MYYSAGIRFHQVVDEPPGRSQGGWLTSRSRLGATYTRRRGDSAARVRNVERLGHDQPHDEADGCPRHSARESWPPAGSALLRLRSAGACLCL